MYGQQYEKALTNFLLNKEDKEEEDSIESHQSSVAHIYKHDASDDKFIKDLKIIVESFSKNVSSLSSQISKLEQIYKSTSSTAVKLEEKDVQQFKSTNDLMKQILKLFKTGQSKIEDFKKQLYMAQVEFATKTNSNKPKKLLRDESSSATHLGDAFDKLSRIEKEFKRNVIEFHRLEYKYKHLHPNIISLQQHKKSEFYEELEQEYTLQDSSNTLVSTAAPLSQQQQQQQQVYLLRSEDYDTLAVEREIADKTLKRIKTMEKEFVEINELFKDFHDKVESNTEKLDLIHTGVVDSTYNVEMGVEEIRMSRKYLMGTSFLIIIVLGITIVCSVLIAAILVIIIISYIRNGGK